MIEVVKTLISQPSNHPIDDSLMKSEYERLKTFHDPGWKCSYVSPQQLARIGFFYLGFDDAVKCAFCSSVFSEWQVDDNPEFEHKSFASSCPFLLGHDVGNQPISEDPYKYEAVDVCGYSHRFLPSTLCHNSRSLSTATLQEPVSPGPGKVYSPPKNLDYATLDSRLKTFTNWPTESPVKPDRLAEAGFFFPGTVETRLGSLIYDYVECWHCGGGLGHWVEGDDPWCEHARLCPECDFVYSQKGKEFITSVKAEAERRSSMERNQQLELHSSEETVTTTSISLFNLTVINNNLNNSHSQSTISSESIGINNNNNHSNKTGQMECQKIEPVKIYKEATENFQRIIPSTFRINSIRGKLCSNRFSQFIVKQTTKLYNIFISYFSKSVPSTSIVQETSSDLNNLDFSRFICKICLESEVGITFIPCEHCVCINCAPRISKCPFCREVIDKIVRMRFLS